MVKAPNAPLALTQALVQFHAPLVNQELILIQYSPLVVHVPLVIINLLSVNLNATHVRAVYLPIQAEKQIVKSV
jgi:hypothetical protein